MKKYFSIIFMIVCSQSFSQSKITGRIVGQNKSPIPYVNIIVEGTTKYAVSDENGSFTIEGLKNISHTLVLSSMGYKTIKKTVDLSKRSSIMIEIVLLFNTESLEEIVLESKSQVRIINEQPLAVSSIDAQLFQNLNIDAASLLDRSNGVRVRQSGGLGSEVNISIQGSQGNAIRRYFDGLPIKFLAAGLDINNLPVNQIERIDIYRGVTPLDVGTDALGGGINIVPKKFKDTYIDVTYQFGSFNTHRPSVNMFYLSDNDVFIGSNFFLNYADNNYKIDAQGFNEETRQAEKTIEVERFNDLYRSYFAEFYTGIRDKPWAKELKVSFIYNTVYDEVQTGIVFNPVRPAGDIFNTKDGFTGSVDYTIHSRDDKLQIKTKTNFGVYEEKVTDSTAFFYNWFGERLDTPNNIGADLLGGAAKISIDNEIFLQRTTVSYAFNPSQKLTISNLFIDQHRKGSNELIAAQDDPFRFPAALQQNYAGVEWSAKWFDSAIETITTYKNYTYIADATSLENVIDQEFERQNTSNNYHGGNAALKYSFTNDFFLRGSYEYAYRLPEEAELFGNQTTIRSNITLRPEQSDNYNLGASYKANMFSTIPVAVELNGFYRYQRDRIVLLASGFDLAQFFNEEEVEIIGIDGYISVKPLQSMRINFAATYQDIIIQSALVKADQDLIGTRVPNIPSFFLSFDATYDMSNLLVKNDKLSVSYFYDFIDKFSSIREANANENVANFVPAQHINSFEAVYITANQKWSFSAKANNIFNDDAYDNFRVQRPGTNFNMKLRYTIQ